LRERIDSINLHCYGGINYICLEENGCNMVEKMDFREELSKICPKAKQGANIYFFGCGKHFEDLRVWYRSFAGINIEDFAFAFIDNDINKQGKAFHGKQVVSPDFVNPDNSVVLITALDYPDISIDRQMMDKGFFWRNDLLPSYDIYRILKSWIFSNIMRFKDIHKNERCFIIGGGPSLLMSDLDVLINEKTFAMNHIYKVFDKTGWRPTYYVAEDENMIMQWRTIDKNISGCKFLNFSPCLNEINKREAFHIENVNYFSLMYTTYERPAEYKKFTFGEYPDIFFCGGSSTYSCLQLAVFMGFKEIYLIGIDHEYSTMLKNSGEVVSSKKQQDHVVSEYHNESLMEGYKSRGLFALHIDVVTEAYKTARDYAESHGIKIYNATRGGKLEIFERVDFDSLILKLREKN